MDEPALGGSFFTRTLGEAALLNARSAHPFPTVPRLLDYQAIVAGSRNAVGFFPGISPSQHDGAPKYQIYNFAELRLAAIASAESLSSQWPLENKDRKVALIGRSTQSFLLAWLGLVYLGYSVLLLSPDLNPHAIVHLCEECNATRLVYDSTCLKVAKNAQTSCHHILEIYSLPLCTAFPSLGLNDRDHMNTHLRPVSNLDIAYYHHSSGTSGALPKLLPVTHKMAIGVLAYECWNPSAEATFSTTPIYHGGVADCFRSWAATTQIWLYPGDVAMTGRVLQRCVDGARDAYAAGLAQKLAYISCVPVVLNHFAESREGIKSLQSMQMVGVGGAAMPEQLGNRLVDEGVNLISRYGTTECGFLLSSCRSFNTDRDWQYLRHDPRVTALRFELQADGLFELVVDKTWPALVKATREDGSFATMDLFKPHRSIPHAWQYHSRADAQITLSTGKKFDPTPSEDNIRQSDLLEDILIFGEDHTFPGALLFRSPHADSIQSSEILNRVWDTIQENNAHAPKHAKLHKSMLVVMPSSSSGLPKSSKGTTLRKQAVKFYKTNIENAYATERFREDASLNKDCKDISRVELHGSRVVAIIAEIVKTAKEGLDNMTVEDDFFNHGIDSTDCVRIREKIQARMIPSHCPNLPLDVIYDNGNIANLSDFVNNFRRGITTDLDDELQLMKDLVAKYGDWQTPNSGSCRDAHIAGSKDVHGKDVVLITGVTGTLGAHVLSQLSTQSSVGEIHCLIRGASTTAARERVRKSLLHRQLPPLNYAGTTRIYYHPCNLSQPKLGLPEESLSNLSQRVTLIVHAAWTVNFTTRLFSFVKDNIAGLHNLIGFATTSSRSMPPHFVFCSSTASATATDPQSSVPESILDDPQVASAIGYSRSKWVAEQICDQAHQKTRLQNNISILRMGQLCGDTNHGVWNMKEAWPLMLSSSTVTGCLPDLGPEPLNWLPVDKAAKALLDIAMPSNSQSEVDAKVDHCVERLSDESIDSCQVYHIINPSTERTWVDVIEWMRQTCPSLETVPPAAWLARIEGLDGKAANHPSQALLGFWQGLYGVESVQQQKHQPLSFDMAQTKKVSPVMRDVGEISEEHFLKMWAWIRDNVGEAVGM